MGVCCCEDEFVQEQYFYAPRWVAELSDGRRVYMDDYRPCETQHSAWIRLKDLVAQEGVRVVSLYIQFRSHVESPLPRNQDGYFFAKGLMSGINGSQYGSFVIGYLQGESLKVQRWQVPELILTEEEERDPATAGEFLLRNPA
jgi:hypothetical protein